MDSTMDLAAAADFVWRNARLLERHLFAYLFADGAREPVLAALRAYQNADGGFGNALEPDKRCPAGQPVDVEMAFNVLDWVDGFGDPMVARACEFLSAISTKEGGVPFVLPSVNDYPHAPWWETAPDPPAALNPTASIAGLLLKHRVRHPWLDGAVAFCREAIEATETRQFHDLMPVLTFLAHAPDRAWAAAQQARVLARIAEPGTVELDPHAGGYTQKPLDWAPTPESACRPLFSDAVIAGHLDALAARQQADGGWPINWDPISPGVELEWRGYVTVQALRTLRGYGVIA